MHWRLKGLLQGLISFAPGSARLNRALQLRFGGLRDPEREIDKKVVDDWLVFAGHLRELSLAPRGLVFLEVGTGWYPTLPMCFALAGAAAIETFDQTRHLDEGLTWRMLRRLERHLGQVAAAAGLELDVVRARHQELLRAPSSDALLTAAGIRYHAPADASRSRLPDGSVDVLFSNSVLEHVTPEALAGIMRESVRVLRNGGYAIHSVNCGDHYAYTDPSISQVNYLRYSDFHWRLWNNRLLYQNRLRAPDFVRAAKAAGLEMVSAHVSPKAQLVAEVAAIDLPERFRSYSLEELSITSIDLVARKAALP